MKLKKSLKYIIPLVIILVGGMVAYGAYQNSNKPIQYQTANVVRGQLQQTVDATGSVSSAEEISLSFKTSGQIGRMNVNVGDQVKAGQVLASISDPSLAAQVDRARAMLLAAEADLTKLLRGSTPEELKVGEEKIASAQAQLDSAKVTLANAQTQLQRTHESYIDSAVQALIDNEFVAQFTLDTIYDVALDYEADANFKTTDTAALLATQTDYDASHSALVSVNKDIENARVSRDPSTILKTLRSLLSNLNGISKALENGLDALSAGIPNPSTNYSAENLETYRATFNTRATAIGAAKTSVQASISNLTTGEQTLQKAVDDASAAVLAAEKNLSLVQAQHQVTTAKPQDYEIKNQQARVLQAQADVSSAQAKLSDTSIVATIDGIITARDLKQGEVATMNQSVLKMIGNSKLQIEVDIPESDITKVALGQNVSITLDAFGPDRTFTGKVTFIEPSKRVIQDVVYYRVTINFDESSTEIKPGMTANITIMTAEKNDVLIVPFRAVQAKEGGAKSVRVLNADMTVSTLDVTTGLRSDDGMIEVISGLSDGQKVIVGEEKK